MKRVVPARAALAALVLNYLLVSLAPSARAAVSASGDGLMPSQDTSHDFNGTGFQVTETVASDPSFGPWQTRLVNSQDPHPSGRAFPVTQTLTNTGPAAWTGWRAEVRSRSTVGGGGADVPGFLFHDSSLFVQADYGSGLVTLTPGTDYIVAPTLWSGPPTMGNDSHWEAFSIFLAAARAIKTGDQLRIQSDVFEIFNDGDPWRPEEQAVIAQFPVVVPEPQLLGMLAGGAGAACAPRRRRTA